MNSFFPCSRDCASNLNKLVSHARHEILTQNLCAITIFVQSINNAIDALLLSRLHNDLTLLPIILFTILSFICYAYSLRKRAPSNVRTMTKMKMHNMYSEKYLSYYYIISFSVVALYEIQTIKREKSESIILRLNNPYIDYDLHSVFSAEQHRTIIEYMRISFIRNVNNGIDKLYNFSHHPR